MHLFIGDIFFRLPKRSYDPSLAQWSGKFSVVDQAVT